MRKTNRLIALLVALPLAACGTSPATQPSSAPPPPPQTSTAPAAWVGQLKELETRFDARLGVFAINVVSGKSLSQRGDERFGIYSVFKGYAAAALLKAHPVSSGFLNTRIHFTQADVLPNSPVSSTRVASGMTVAELCEAAITVSDNTAGNQILKILGGPAKLTEFARSTGDTVTRLDRWEPELNVVARGEEHDTTSPTAIANAFRALVLGNALDAPERDQLKAWLLANKTGDARIRAGVPKDWKTADKTGTGEHAGLNDVAITWPDPATPIVIAVLTDKTALDAKGDNALIAETAKIVARELR